MLEQKTCLIIGHDAAAKWQPLAAEPLDGLLCVAKERAARPIARADMPVWIVEMLQPVLCRCCAKEHRPTLVPEHCLHPIDGSGELDAPPRRNKRPVAA